MIELDNTMLLFIGSENYSGRKIPWAEMSVRADDVRVPVNGPVSELDLFGLCSGASPQLQVGVVDINFRKDSKNPQD